MNLRRIHYFSGIVLSIFVGMHLFNHIWAILGIEKHISLMAILRLVYRNIFVEVLLLAVVFGQVITGFALVRKHKGISRIGWDRWHIWSGLYLSFFLLFHCLAVLAGRSILHLDTNFYFGAAGMSAFPTGLFFVPYYILAIMSFFTHIAAVHSKKMERNLLGISPHQQSLGIVLMGAFVLILVLWGMTQGFTGVDVPQGYEVLQGK